MPTCRPATLMLCYHTNARGFLRQTFFFHGLRYPNNSVHNIAERSLLNVKELSVQIQTCYILPVISIQFQGNWCKGKQEKSLAFIFALTAKKSVVKLTGSLLGKAMLCFYERTNDRQIGWSRRPNGLDNWDCRQTEDRSMGGLFWLAYNDRIRARI